MYFPSFFCFMGRQQKKQNNKVLISFFLFRLVHFHLTHQFVEGLIDGLSIFGSSKNNFPRTKQEYRFYWSNHLMNSPREAIIFLSHLILRQSRNINSIPQISISYNIGNFKSSQFDFFVNDFLNLFYHLFCSNFRIIFRLRSNNDHPARLEDKDRALRLQLPQDHSWKSLFIVTRSRNLLRNQFELKVRISLEPCERNNILYHRLNWITTHVGIILISNLSVFIL